MPSTYPSGTREKDFEPPNWAVVGFLRVQLFMSVLRKSYARLALDQSFVNISFFDTVVISVSTLHAFLYSQHSRANILKINKLIKKLWALEFDSSVD